MANVKITDLTTHTNPVSTDVLPIVDVGTDVTKKISIADLLENAGSGTELAPGIAFDGDSNTGIYRPGAHQLAISTNGTQRLLIDDSGRVGVGVTPESVFHVKGPQPFIIFEKSAGSFSALILKTTGSAQSDYTILASSSGSEFLSNRYVFKNVTASTEYMRLDSSGRLLLGTSSARANFRVAATNYTGTVQHETGGQPFFTVVSGNADKGGPYLVLGHQRSGVVGGNTLVANSDELGVISFQGSDGTNLISGARIEAAVDGTPGTDDMPGRLVFSVTADGDSSPDEVMRITSDKYVRLASGTGGIQFNGDTAAANALDDYEEGTFTPTFGYTTADLGGTVAYSSQVGRYIKIGKQITVFIRVILTDKGNAASHAIDARIRGLPFVARSQSPSICPVHILNCATNIVSSSARLVVVESGSNNVAIDVRTTASASTSQLSAANFFTDTTSVVLNATYETT